MKRVNKVLYLILGIGLILNIWGISFGLKNGLYLLYDENLIVNIYNKMIESKNLNPCFFIYSTLFLYIYGIIYLISLLFNDIVFFYLLGRLFTAILGSAAVFITYLICSRVFNKKAGLYAAFLNTTALVYVQSSHYIKADIPSVFFLLIAIWFAYRILDKARLSDYLYAGIFSGICISIKYNIFIIIPIATASLLSKDRIFNKGWKMFIEAITMGLTFIISSPFCILDFPAFWKDLCVLIGQVRHINGMWWISNMDGIANWKWYIIYLTKAGLYYPFIIAVLGGILILIKKIDKKILFLFSFPLVYAVQIMFFSSIRADRYTVPLIPFFSIFAGVFIYKCRESMKQGLWNKSRLGLYTLNIFGIGIFLVLPMIRCAVMDYYLAKKDTRILVQDWIAKNISKSSKVLVIGIYPGDIVNNLKDNGWRYIEDTGLNFNPDQYIQLGYDYIIISSGAFHVYKNYANSFNYRSYNNYKKLLESGQLVKEIRYQGFNWWFSNFFQLEYSALLTVIHHPTIKIFKLPKRNDSGLARFRNEYRAPELIIWSNGVVVNDSESKDGKAVYNGGIYGPYETYFKGEYTVMYRLKVDNNGIEDPVCAIDVVSGGGGKEYIRREIKGVDFNKAGEYQDFILPLRLAENSPLEFRVHYYGKCNLWVECIEVEEVG